MSASKLQNKVALITGAGRGIGRAIAIEYAKEGAAVAATARTKGELDSLVEEIGKMGGKAIAIPADLADPKIPIRIVNDAEAAFGTVDILVNNAGVGSSANPRPVLEFDDEFWSHTLAVNLTAPYLLSKATLPLLLRKGRGRILNIASLAAKVGLLHGCAYAASKHGLLGLTRTLAIECAKTGITVNAICPGPVRSSASDLRIRYDAERLGRNAAELESSLTPLGRRLEPQEIVPMALFLASDESATITGQAFNVCAGVAMF